MGAPGADLQSAGTSTSVLSCSDSRQCSLVKAGTGSLDVSLHLYFDTEIPKYI